MPDEGRKFIIKSKWEMGKRKRQEKAKLKAKLSTQLLLIPQSIQGFTAIGEKSDSKMEIKINKYEKPPHQVATDTTFLIETYEQQQQSAQGLRRVALEPKKMSEAIFKVFKLLAKLGNELTLDQIQE